MSNGSFILATRPIEVAGRPPVQIVGYFEADFKSPGARAFFDWLITTEAQGSLTDTFAAVDGALTRAFGPKCDPAPALKCVYLFSVRVLVVVWGAGQQPVAACH